MSFKIQTFEAYQLNRELPSGRTKPCVVTCSRAGHENVEFVVKLRKAVNFNETGLTCELVSALLAKKLGLSIPNPSLILISREFAESISIPHICNVMKESVGLNFGSALISGGSSTWPVNKPLPLSLEEKASEIIAFDAMVQNPDRRTDKPNVLSGSQELYIIDHEMAFSFLHSIGSVQPQPYAPEAFSSFLRKHLFYGYFKGKDLKLDRFIAAIGSTSEDDIEQIFDVIPSAWKNDATPKIKTHLLKILKQPGKFIDSVREVII
jgi:hypothetical protein